MADACESGMSAVSTDTVVQYQVTAIDANLNSIAEEGHNSTLR